MTSLGKRWLLLRKHVESKHFICKSFKMQDWKFHIQHVQSVLIKANIGLDKLSVLQYKLLNVTVKILIDFFGLKRWLRTVISNRNTVLTILAKFLVPLHTLNTALWLLFGKKCSPSSAFGHPQRSLWLCRYVLHLLLSLRCTSEVSVTMQICAALSSLPEMHPRGSRDNTNVCCTFAAGVSTVTPPLHSAENLIALPQKCKK